MIGDTATRLRNLATRLKTGQYDGKDIMEAWIALREFAKYQWQPIETAPKNGDEVLIYVPDPGEQFVAYWHPRFNAWLYASTDSGVRVFTKEATHWMPLPPTHNIQPETTGGAP